MSWNCNINLSIGILCVGSVLVILINQRVVTAGAAAQIEKTSNGFFKCPEDPITEKYPDPNDPYCIHYFLCHRSHAFPSKCPERFVFHPQEKACLARDRVPESICPNEINCGFNGYYKDNNDCTKYYLCFYRNPTHYSCTKDHIFDEAKKQCVLNKEKAYSCSKPKPLPHYSTQPQSTWKKN